MGKTAVFALAPLQQLEVDEGLSRVSALCHTRKLAFQIGKEDERFCKFMPSMKISVFYECVPLKNDIDTIKNGKPQIVVATPGRLLDLVKQKALSLDDFRHFNIDECDKILESVSMRADIQQIFKLTPTEKKIDIRKCFAGETSRWQTKMAAPIFGCQ